MTRTLTISLALAPALAQITRIEATTHGLKGVTDTVDATLKRLDSRRYDYVTRVGGKNATTSSVVVTAGFSSFGMLDVKPT